MKSKHILAASIAALCGFAATTSAATIEVGTASVSTISQDTRWTRDNVYVLTRVIYVVPPAKLTIEPGTLIRAVRADGAFHTGPTTEPGALVITRGAKIVANGTPDDPIIFTGLGDPHVPGGAATIPATVNGVSTASYIASKNYAPDGPTGNNGFSQEKEWGGVIVLGQAPIGYDGDGDTNILQYNAATNTYSGDGIAYPTGPTPLPGANDVKGGNGVGLAIVEGLVLSSINLSTLTPPGSFTEPFPNAAFDPAQATPGAGGRPAANSIIGGVYGGLNRDDSSGVLRFCSNRYGGFVVGTDNEINGFTFGGTGRGTVVDWLESYNNADDGFEFFGGFTAFKYLFSLFQGDDGFDGDQGFNGNFQFCFNITNNAQEVRTGFSGAGNGSASGRLAADVGDNCAEWDGSEDNNVGVTPNTDQFFRNFTFVHDAGVTNKNGIFSRRSVAGNWQNGIVQDVSKAGGATLDALPATPVKDSIVFAQDNANPGTNPGTNPTITANSQLVSDFHQKFQGLDPRQPNNSEASALSFSIPAFRGGAFPFSGFTPVSYAGCMRDNNMLRGWSVLDYLDLVAPANVARPAVTIGSNAGNATVSWNAAPGVGGRAVVYALERSNDRRAWTPVAVVQDGVTGLNASAINAAGYSTVTTDSNATAGQVQVVDTVSGPLTAGTARYYRVIPQ